MTEFDSLVNSILQPTRALGGLFALLISAGSMTSTASASEEGAGQQARMEANPITAILTGLLQAGSQPAAPATPDTRSASTGVAPASGGVPIQNVQYQTMRPVYTTTPAQTYAPQPAQVVQALTQVSPLAVPLMAAPVFTQPVMSYINAWQPQQAAQPAQQPVYYQQQQAAQPAQQPVYYQQQQVAQQPAAAASGHWFLNWLNSTRAQYGLGAVGYDANLEAWAQMNNAQQNARGLGHHVMGPASRQNSAMGSADSIGSMWMNSPAHRAALLDPGITAIGLAGSGSYWTFNAR
jgi:uncharacterized protein YkwD